MVALHRPPVLLELDLTVPLVEAAPADPMAAFLSRRRPRLHSVLRTLHEAGSDRRVAGLVVKVGGVPRPWAVMQELRAGLHAFSCSGKPAVAWAESFGEGGSSAVDYVLATGCPEIWVQPTGEIGPLGVAADATFLRGVLDKLAVEPQFGQRKEYKNAADQLLRKEFSPAHHEAVDRLVESVWEEAIASIAAGRGLDPSRLRDLAAAGPISAPAALAAGLIDRVGYRDEVYASVRSRVGEDARLAVRRPVAAAPPAGRDARPAPPGRGGAGRGQGPDHRWQKQIGPRRAADGQRHSGRRAARGPP